MQTLTAHNEFWLNHDGQTVKINGLAHKLEVSTLNVRDGQTKLSVYATPSNKNSEYYKEFKRKLGDDWATDVLESFDVCCDVMRQLGY